MTWTLCTSGAAIGKAGINANSSLIGYSGTSKAILDSYSSFAEAQVCAELHTDFITNLANYPTPIQNAVADVVSSRIAMQIVSYDPRGYLSREADYLMNLNNSIYQNGIILLRNKEKLSLS